MLMFPCKSGLHGVAPCGTHSRPVTTLQAGLKHAFFVTASRAVSPSGSLSSVVVRLLPAALKPRLLRGVACGMGGS